MFSFSKEPSVMIEKSIELNLSNIRNTDGCIYVFVYSYENQYPYNPFAYFKFKKETIQNGNLQVVLSDLQLNGTCALTILDDENSNDDLDRWFGIPTEGYGFSNNIRPFFSLPDYEELLFDPLMKKQVHVELQYKL